MRIVEYSIPIHSNVPQLHCQTFCKGRGGLNLVFEPEVGASGQANGQRFATIQDLQLAGIMTTTKETNGLPKEAAMAEKIGSQAEIKLKLINF